MCIGPDGLGVSALRGKTPAPYDAMVHTTKDYESPAKKNKKRFLVDRTYGRHYATVLLCPSVCRLSSVTYVLWLNVAS